MIAKFFLQFLVGYDLLDLWGGAYNFIFKHIMHLAFVCAIGASLANKCLHECWRVSYSIFQSHSGGGDEAHKS